MSNESKRKIQNLLNIATQINDIRQLDIIQYQLANEIQFIKSISYNSDIKIFIHHESYRCIIEQMEERHHLNLFWKQFKKTLLYFTYRGIRFRPCHHENISQNYFIIEYDIPHDIFYGILETKQEKYAFIAEKVKLIK
jgi:hypothetical protein